MNYELAKQLKDAGFPQVKNLRTFEPGCPHWGTKDRPIGDMSCGCWIACPTLEELIEACGTSIMSIRKVWNKSGAITNWICEGDYPRILTVGTTPLIAVANLWLALNQKS